MDADSGASDISFKELERFVAIIERGGLTEASRTLGVTQQALGRTITKLEDIVGAKLLIRSKGSHTKATLYGDVFLRYAKSQLSDIARALEHMQSLSDARAGQVALGIGETCDVKALGMLIGDFHRQQPDVQIDLLEDYTEPLLDKLVEGELDWVIGAIPDADFTRRGVTYEALYSIDDIVVARTEHPLHSKRKLTLEDLQPYTWLVARRRTQDWAAIRAAFLDEGLEPPARVIRTDAAMVGMQLMLTDDYLFMVPPAMLEGGAQVTGLKRLRVAKPTVTRHAGLMTMPNRPLNPASAALLDFVRASAQRGQ